MDTSILWELCGIKQQVESRILVDYQYYRVLRWGQAWNAITGFLPIKKSGDWNSLPKGKVFLIRYFDGTKEIINDLRKLEEQAKIDARPKVKHPFIPINKDENLPCPAEFELNDGKSISVIIYDMEREYVHYRKKEWQNGPIFRMQKSKIKDITIKQKLR